MEKLTDKTSSMDALLESESDESGSDAESSEQPNESAPDALLNRLNQVRTILWALLRQIEGLSSKIEEVTKNKSEDEGDNALKLETHFRSEYATLEIEFAKKQQDEVLVERQIARRERNTGIISQLELEKRQKALKKRYIIAGDDLWRSSNEKLHLENPTAIISIQLDSDQSAASKIPELLLPLYRKPVALITRRNIRRKPSNWTSDVIEYYSANWEDHGKTDGSITWCHANGSWYPSYNLGPARIVPFLIAANKLEELIFGSVSESVQHPANALLLGGAVRDYLEAYKIVIVPVDNSETPIKRWRIDLLFPSLGDYRCGLGENWDKTRLKDLDGKELSFLGERRPSPRFLYFHFIMALLRLKDCGSDGWQQIWARYYEQRPFPPTNNYMRKAMIKALATYFEVADMKVVESWVSDQGFDTQIQIQDDQAKELARRVHRIVDTDIYDFRDDRIEELSDNYGQDTEEEE